MKKVIIAISLLICVSVLGQQLPSLSFEKFNTDMGLASNMPKLIYQDKQGAIWIGSNGGTNVYDGYTFRTYKTDEDDSYSVNSNVFNDVVEDFKGNLWFSCSGAGLDFYETETGRFHNYGNDPKKAGSLPIKTPKTVVIDNNNRIWLADKNSYYVASLQHFYDNSELVFTQFSSEILNNTNNSEKHEVQCIETDVKGNVWISTSDFVAMVDVSTDEVKIISNITSPDIQNWNNSIWYFKNKELFRAYYNTNGILSIQSFTNASKTYIHGITAFAFDKNKMLWIGTLEGVYTAKLDVKSNTFSLTSYSVSNKCELDALSGSQIVNRGIYVDKTNNVWLATQKSGLSRYNAARKSFKHIKMNDTEGSLNFKTVRTIKEDEKNNLWIGGNGGGQIAIIKTNDRNGLYNKFINTKSDNSIFYGTVPKSPTYTICEISSENNSKVYFYSWGKKLISTSTTGIQDSIVFTTYHNNSLPGSAVMHMYADKDYSLWISHYNGGLNHVLFNEQGEVDTFYTYKYNPDDSLSLPNDIARYTYQTKDGTIWVGTGAGLSRVHRSNSNDNNIKFENFCKQKGKSNSLSNDYILTITETKDNTLWVGTYGGGLNKVEYDENNKPVFTSYTTKDGLVDNIVKAIVEDDNGDLWISTGNGISQFNPNTGSFRNYTKDDGLLDNEFQDNSSEKLSTGELLFGGINGITAFYPDSIKDNPYPAQVTISSLKVNNKHVDVGQKFSKGIILPKRIQFMDKIKLGYKERIIEFGLSTDHFANPKANKIRYMLEPMDENWIETGGNRNYVSYSDLKGGRYTFRVQAANPDGLWGDVQSLELRIVPPWWKTTLFRIFFLGFIVYAIYWFINQREKTARENKEKLESKIKEGEELINEKMKEVDAQKQEILKRDEQEKEIRFTNRGIARFSTILSKEDVELKTLSNEIICELVLYVEGVLGTIYVWNDGNIDDQFLLRTGNYASENSVETEKVTVGEGYVGTCFKVCETLIINDIPDGYVMLTSGLGKLKPNYLYLIPIKQGTNIQGVIEIATLKELEDYKVKFIEKIGENITSTITIKKSNERMDVLLEESKLKAEELAAQEEEMRQNLEEMQATQEEMQRRMEVQEQLKNNIKQLESENTKLRSELDKLK